MDAMIPNRLRVLYRRSFRQPRRERLFLASISFFVAFGVTRALTHFAHTHGDDFLSVHFGDVHVHHLVWGIMLLLLVGYLWLVEADHGQDRNSTVAGRIAAVLYGVGAALTLDEFALWLTLEDVYWKEQGRASVDAVMWFGAMISAGFWGGPFLRLAARRLWRRRPSAPLDPTPGAPVPPALPGGGGSRESAPRSPARARSAPR